MVRLLAKTQVHGGKDNAETFHLGEPVVAQVELLQTGPFVDGSAQIQLPDAVLAEHQLSEVARLPATGTWQGGDVVGPHVYWAQARWAGGQCN